MEENKIHIMPFNQGTDAATAMAMQNNNPWMYLLMLGWLYNGNFGNRGANGALDIETQNKLNSLQAQINDNNNNQWAREAIQGNGFAISQLSQNLGINFNALQAAATNINAAIAQLGASTGMGFTGVSNAINLGNLNIIQQLKDCCCASQKQVLEQGYENRIQTIQQTNELQTSLRVENGLTRTEVAAFRQAWENSRYQDLLAANNRLQTELDLLRQSNGTAAAINAAVAPVAQQVQGLQFQFQNFFNTYGGKTAAASGS